MSGNSKCKSCQQCAKPYPPGQGQSAPYLFYDNKGLSNGSPALPQGPVARGPPQLPEGSMSIHTALGVFKKNDLEALLVQNPSAIHEKGFNGQSPLHKAVMGSDIEIIDLLLRFKADPNAVNNFNETPFHFACKRGLPTVMKLLIENGADINMVDKGGKGPIHHAAHGGSVYGLHYLTDVHGLSTHVRDLNLSTPLHVVAAHGHVEALKYLLRKDRCDVLAVNAHANNALHIAANSGHGWTCWKILEQGGLELLYQQNREGNTPLDLADKKAKDPKFRETIILLSYYMFSRKQKGPAVGPVLAWYFHGLMPLLGYALVILVAGFFTRAGTVALAGMVILLATFYQHTHRMNHICRWPNPLYFGMFLAGIIHSSICFYVEVLPYIYADHKLLIFLMSLWNVSFCYFYYKLLVTDPGTATESAQKPGSLWCYSMKDVAEGSLKMEAFCTHCELIPPKLTHHCKLCLQCYLNTDHHCLFLYRCIARNNHRLFVLFCMVVVAGITMLLVSLTYYFRVLYPARSLNTDLLAEIYENRPWPWTVFLANAISLFWGINLVRFQLSVVSKAQTTVYQPNCGSTRLTKRERFYNIVYFLMGRGYFATDEEVTI